MFKTIKKYFPWLLLAALAMAATAVWHAVFFLESRQHQLIFHVFDIGQGDSLFIEAPNGNQVLIDGGPSSAVLAELGKTLPFWDHSIDLVVLTHPHADHVTGLIDVLKRYRVARVLESDVNYPTPEYAEWHKLLEEKHIPVSLAERGQVIRLGDGAELDVLAPFSSFVGESPKNVHDAVIVMKLEYASSTALLMGDGEAQLEYQFLASGDDLHADVLKVGHHGSHTSSIQPFLEAVRATLAVIPVGAKNRYGHPHQEVLDRLRSLGIPTLRTDVDGAITLVSSGGAFRRQ